MILHICKGLPGSGKSTFLRKRSKELESSLLINLDDILNIEFYDELKHIIKKIKYKNILIDILILDEKRMKDIISIVKTNKPELNEVYVYEYNEDRKLCLINDQVKINDGKRNLRSDVTIKTVQYEKLDKAAIKKWGIEQNIKISIINKTVYEMDNVDKYLEKITLATSNNGTVESTGYCLGGFSKNYNGDVSIIHPEMPPIIFQDFDDFISKLVPDISFMQYRQLLSLVKSGEKHQTDYYGGESVDGYYYFYPEDVIKKLEELNLID